MADSITTVRVFTNVKMLKSLKHFLGVNFFIS